MPDTDSKPPLLSRLLFASGLVTLALRNLNDLEGRIAYADAKGVPFAERLVPAASGLLLGGSLGIGLWKLPRLAAGSVAAFLVGVTPLMHDFWAADEESRDEEVTSFLQNVTLLGAAVAFYNRASGGEREVITIETGAEADSSGRKLADLL
ncbi:DoxX family membrane protein [Halobacterium sp. R2-5]|nr:DoxX family membrane protein [Halobacterium sp. R2-5]NIC00514.1 DoxX family membrane protein [Halobacterium sp. R2-5]